MKQPAVHRYGDSRERPIDEGCLVRELSNSGDDPGLSIAEARVPPGVTTRWHRLRGVAERYLVQRGSGRAEIGDAPPVTLLPGDVVCIPPGCRQRISNTGEGDLQFLALCTPRFTPDCYEDLEDG